MVNTIKIKCFVKHDGSPPTEEIRLFKVDAESDTVYDDLIAKLVACFKDGNYEFAINWTDEEGDDIKVSSNGELQAALEELLNNETQRIPKIHVSVNKPANQLVWGGYCNKVKKDKKQKTKGMKVVPNWENPNMTHPGVTCDACDGPIMGPRWKCNTCPDFDLCKPCKVKGNHTQHVFIKIPYRLRNWRTVPDFFQVPWEAAPIVVEVVAPSQQSQEPSTEFSTDADDSTMEKEQAMDDNLINLETEKEEVPISTMESTESTNVEATSLVEMTEDMYISDNMIGEQIQSTAACDEGICENDGEFVMLNANEESEAAESLVPEVGMTTDSESLYPSIPEDAAPITPTLSAAPASFTPLPSFPTAPAVGPATPEPSVVQNLQGVPITNLALPPHVFAALSCMLDMGYTNRGEWLAKLLFNKNGDINAVIDILNARSK